MRRAIRSGGSGEETARFSGLCSADATGKFWFDRAAGSRAMVPSSEVNEFCRIAES